MKRANKVTIKETGLFNFSHQPANSHLLTHLAGHFTLHNSKCIRYIYKTKTLAIANGSRFSKCSQFHLRL